MFFLTHLYRQSERKELDWGTFVSILCHTRPWGAGWKWIWSPVCSSGLSQITSKHYFQNYLIHALCFCFSVKTFVDITCFVVHVLQHAVQWHPSSCILYHYPFRLNSKLLLLLMLLFLLYNSLFTLYELYINCIIKSSSSSSIVIVVVNFIEVLTCAILKFRYNNNNNKIMIIILHLVNVILTVCTVWHLADSVLFI